LGENAAAFGEPQRARRGGFPNSDLRFAVPHQTDDPVLESFRRAAGRVPAYGVILKEAGVDAAAILSREDFAALPVLDKRGTFQRFAIDQLCVDGRLGRLGSVLTSSGHSGVFAFGLTSAEERLAATAWIDDLLDHLFQVRSKPTLLINCLPMGVKVPTQECTLAETSVRPDMAIGLVKAFGPFFFQIVLVGDAAFIKHLLELGRRQGVDWAERRIHLILGEEPLAENARSYLEGLLAIVPELPEQGRVLSSMGVAELGLNLFSEVSPTGILVRLRRVLHETASLRHSVLGPVDWVPSLFTYDPRRIFVEFDRDARLIVTTLDPDARIPLIRYATGDRGRILTLPPDLNPPLEAAGISCEFLAAFPVVVIEGRGEHALAGKLAVYPEAVKEGLYRHPELAEVTTANFRLTSGPVRARIRIQLSPGVQPTRELEGRFQEAIEEYARQPLEVACEAYATFGNGMALDYERKFPYLEK